MKPLRAFLASLITLSLMPLPVGAQGSGGAPTPVTGKTGPDNPHPELCCQCFQVTVLGCSPRKELVTDKKNKIQITVVIKRDSPPPGYLCPPEIPVTAYLDIYGPTGVVHSETPRETILGATPKILKFEVLSKNARLGDMMRISTRCASTANESDSGDEREGGIDIKGCAPIWIRLGEGCFSCGNGDSTMCKQTGAPSAENGTTTEYSLNPTKAQGFSAYIPTTPAEGGMSDGMLNYFVEGRLNPGRSALIATLPSDMTLNTDATFGHITSIDTGAGTITVDTAEQRYLDLDPNAFTVTHKDKAGNAFRWTTFYYFVDGTDAMLRMDTKFDGAVTRFQQTYPDNETLVMEEGRVIGDVPNDTFVPLRRETLTRTKVSEVVRIDRKKVEERPGASGNWSMVSDVETKLERGLHGWKPVNEVIDPDGEALTSTWTYYEVGEITGADGSLHGLQRLKHHVRYDGYEEFHTYGLNQSTVTSPYLGNPTGKVVTYTWDPGSKTKTETTQLGGTLVSKTKTVHTDTSKTVTRQTSASEALTTTTHYESSNNDFGGQPKRIVHPDQTITTYQYTRKAEGGYTTVMENGSAASGGETVAKGMRTTTVTNPRGSTIYSKTEAVGYGTGGAIYDSMAVTGVDNLGRPTATAYHPETVSVLEEVASVTGTSAWTTTTEYDCCGVSMETDMYGIPTYHAYDFLQRRIKSNRLGVTTETVRDGLTTRTYRYPEQVSGSLGSEFEGTAAHLVGESITNLSGTEQITRSPDPTSDVAGELIQSGKQVTTYNPAPGIGTRVVQTAADNNTQTTDSYIDGRTYKTYGALSPDMTYAYGVNATGETTTQSYDDGGTLRETTTQSDWAGRTVSMTYMDGAVATMTYNALGQMISSTDPDGVTTLYAYNPEGERTITAIDLNGDGDIDYGSDTVSYSETDPATGTIDSNVGSEPVMLTTSKVWKPGDTNSAAGTVVSTSMRSADGLRSLSQSIGFANSSVSITSLGGSGNWTTLSTAPDGTKQVQTYTAGLLASSASLKTDNSVLMSMDYGYDDLNRPITSDDSRTGVTTTAYLSFTADVVKSVTDPGNRSTYFTYDVRGRQVSVNAPDTQDADGNTLANVTNTLYNPDSRVAETNGDQTYRTTHTYDYAQRQASMTTYGSSVATTHWVYTSERGFLSRKEYHDGKGTDYTYTPAGRLRTRTWARGRHTRYDYDLGGRLINTRYFLAAADDTGTNVGNNPVTPDITVTYDCLNRQVSQSNGIATSNFLYDDGVNGNLTLDTETIAYDIDGTPGIDFTRVLDRSRDNLMRDTGWVLKDGTTPENSVSYTYGSTDGRLTNVAGASTSSFDYSYLANSNLLATVTGQVHTVTNAWEATRNVLATKENKAGTTVISEYDYGVNDLGQRTGVNTAGTAFAAVGSIGWGYNSKGEVVQADSSVNAQDRSYQYDGIGNRLKSADSLTLPTSSNYTPNALNQYTAIGSLAPGYDDDGNMTSGPLPANASANSTLVWDGENRLIEATVGTTGPVVRFLYDSQSRRIAQTVGTGGPAGPTTTLYIYDGWNPIAEYDGTTLTKTYTWGMDLSGSMQGAGGVGGLLAVDDGTNKYYPTYDGNGNVSEYLDSTGAIAAHYEYDPFGNITVATGTKKDDFAHRFSTKPLDATTGLYYYGYRYYDPETGRWPSRDPIGERGGVNLYGFVGNGVVGKWDLLGQKALRFEKDPDTMEMTPSDSIFGNTEAQVNFEGVRNFTAWVNPSIPLIGERLNIEGENNMYITYKRTTTVSHDVLLKHERQHIRISKKNWNDFVDAVNPYEGWYCRPCGKKIAAYLNAWYAAYKQNDLVDNLSWDMEDLPHIESYREKWLAALLKKTRETDPNFLKAAQEAAECIEDNL